MTLGIVDWLGGLPPEVLARVLSNRPDCAMPQPRSLHDLGDRLSVPRSVQYALEALDEGCLDVLSAVQACGDRCTRDDVLRLHGIEGESPENFDRAWDRLHEYAVVWSTSEGELRLAGPLRNDCGPLNLGRPLRALLTPLTATTLGNIANEIGAGARQRKQETLEAVEKFLAHPGQVAALLADAPEQAREAANDLAWHGPMYHQVRSGPIGPKTEPARWLLAHGLLAHADKNRANGPFEMPREVALALRGPDYRAPLSPQPPHPAMVDGDPDDVDRTATVAAGRLIAGVARLLEHCADNPMSPLRTGGVGVRALGQLGKTLRAGEKEIRLWLEIAAGARLLDRNVDGELVPSEDAPPWQHAEPADQLVPLLLAWWRLPGAPTTALLADKSPPALVGVSSPVDRVLRHDLVDELAGLPPGQRVRDRTELDALIAWRRPLVHADAKTIAPVSELMWWESDAVGATADTALSGLGRRLREEDADALRALAVDLLPRAQETALLQADLTAVVRGTPGAELSTLLNLTADVEKQDTASTWRFSHASIRRALDEGHSAESLLADLEAIADSAVPQPLSYLVHDVARRYGELTVASVSCCVLGDEALVLEASQHRSLRDLKPTMLAPTVLASSKSVQQTLELLREAGYCPVAQRADGTVQLERGKKPVKTRRRPRRPEPTASTAAPDYQQLATLLLHDAHDESDQRPLPGVVPVDSDAARIAERAPKLSAGEHHVLAAALSHETPVWIDYIDQNGKPTSRPITPLLLASQWLTSWCHMREGERDFRLERIRSVTAVAG